MSGDIVSQADFIVRRIRDALVKGERPHVLAALVKQLAAIDEKRAAELIDLIYHQ